MPQATREINLSIPREIQARLEFANISTRQILAQMGTSGCTATMAAILLLDRAAKREERAS